jgi:hypothetical protein
VCEALIEHHELGLARHEFALPERSVKGRERKVSLMPLGLNLNLATKLFAFAFAFATDQSVNSKFMRVLDAVKSKLVLETRGGLFRMIWLFVG